MNDRDRDGTFGSIAIVFEFKSMQFGVVGVRIIGVVVCERGEFERWSLEVDKGLESSCRLDGLCDIRS